MKVIKIISENKSTHKRTIQKGDAPDWNFRTKIGYCEAIVEIDGKLVTRHMVKI